MNQNFKIYSDNKLIDIIYNESHSLKSQAFTELYSRYNNKVYLYCRKVFGDGSIAEDIFQETFIQFLKNIERKTEITNVLGLLLKIARNLSLNYKRDNKLNLTELEEIHIAFTENDIETKELNQLVESALDLLPEEHKEAFILQIYEGLTYQEIAELTEVPLTTVRNRIVRAKTKLKEILTPFFELNEKSERII